MIAGGGGEGGEGKGTRKCILSFYENVLVKPSAMHRDSTATANAFRKEDIGIMCPQRRGALILLHSNDNSSPVMKKNRHPELGAIVCTWPLLFKNAKVTKNKNAHSFKSDKTERHKSYLQFSLLEGI